MTHKIKKKDGAGFSLVELMFTVVFLSVIVFGVVRLQTGNLVLGNTQNQTARAYYWAMQGASLVEALGYATCAAPVCLLTDATSYSPWNNPPVPATDLIGSLFLRTVTFEPLAISGGEIVVDPAAAPPKGYRATVTVSWEDNSGPHSVSVKRIIR